MSASVSRLVGKRREYGRMLTCGRCGGLYSASAVDSTGRPRRMCFNCETKGREQSERKRLADAEQSLAAQRAEFRREVRRSQEAEA